MTLFTFYPLLATAFRLISPIRVFTSLVGIAVGIKQSAHENSSKHLRISIGNKTVSSYLTVQPYDVITPDVDENLKPTIVGEVTRLPLTPCEVLEHIPLNKVEKALREMLRLSEYVTISLPHFGVYVSVIVHKNMCWLSWRCMCTERFMDQSSGQVRAKVASFQFSYRGTQRATCSYLW